MIDSGISQKTFDTGMLNWTLNAREEQRNEVLPPRLSAMSLDQAAPIFVLVCAMLLVAVVSFGMELILGKMRRHAS